MAFLDRRNFYLDFSTTRNFKTFKFPCVTDGFLFAQVLKEGGPPTKRPQGNFLATKSRGKIPPKAGKNQVFTVRPPRIFSLDFLAQSNLGTPLKNFYSNHSRKMCPLSRKCTIYRCGIFGILCKHLFFKISSENHLSSFRKQL